MQRSLVMTIIGRDRPGLVEAVANLVTEHGGNWLESRMARLGGQFAGILRIQFPVAKEADLLRAIAGLKERGLEVMAHTDLAVPPATRMAVYNLELMGQDRPGIVRQISGALADYGVNVEELETECGSAAMSGETLFKAHARLSIPLEADLSAIRQTLERIAADLIVDITLAQAD